MKKHWEWAVAVAVGGVLRYWGIWFGWPLTSNLYIRPDESLVVVSGAIGQPSTYAYPAFFLELTMGLFRMTGGDPALGFGADPSPYYVAARCLAALFGTLTTGLVYLIGKRVLTGGWPLLAALVYAVSPLAVRDAHYAVTDIPSVFFQSAVVWFALRYVDAAPERAAREFWLGAGALALSMNTKYAGVLLATALASAVLLRARERGERVAWGRLGLCGVGLAAAFAAINPYLLKEWEKAWAEIWSIVEVLYFWQPGDPVWTVRHGVWQVVKPLGQGAGGWLGLAAALAGMGVAAWKREWRVLLAAQPVVATFAILLPFEHTVPYRYLLPALPGLAVLAAYAFRSVNRAPRALVWGAAALALGAVELKTSVELVRRLGEEDTRSMAGAWIRKNVPKGVPVVYLGGAECEPQFEESAGSIERRMEYVNRRYGPVSGAIIAAPYKLMAEARRRGGGRGWEVHRNPLPGTLPAGEKLVVTTEYPLRMTRYTAPYAEAAMEETRPGMVIQGMRLSGACRDFELDLIDAWFLPFRPLECVERPGPNIRMRWLREKGR